MGGGVFQPCLGGVSEGLLGEGMWWLCLWAAKWVEGRKFKVPEGRVDSEPSGEPVLRVEVEGRTCVPKDLGVLMMAERAYRAFHIPSILSQKGH